MCLFKGQNSENCLKGLIEHSRDVSKEFGVFFAI